MYSEFVSNSYALSLGMYFENVHVYIVKCISEKLLKVKEVGEKEKFLEKCLPFAILTPKEVSCKKLLQLLKNYDIFYF